MIMIMISLNVDFPMYSLSVSTWQFFMMVGSHFYSLGFLWEPSFMLNKHCKVFVSCSDQEAVKSFHRLSKTVRSCQKLSKAVKSCQKLSKAVKNCQKLSKTVKSRQNCQMLSNAVITWPMSS